MLRCKVISTVAGPLTVIVDTEAEGDLGPREYGAVIASGFAPVDAMLERLSAKMRDRQFHHDADLGEVGDLTAAYSDDITVLDQVSVLQPGGAFYQQVWSAMRGVRAGTVASYGELAQDAGSPRAARAAGTACATNMVAPFVPCHRIITASGHLGNYGYGVPIKAALLSHEGVTLPS